METSSGKGISNVATLGKNNFGTTGIIASGSEALQVRNDTGLTIHPYTVVKVSGDYSDALIPKIIPVTATIDTPIGIITKDIFTGTVGIAIKRGRVVTTLNTSASTVGAKVYWNTSTGLLSLISTSAIVVGQILTLAVNGVVYFNLGGGSGGGGGGSVQSVTGLNTNNTDPTNPVVNIAVDGVTITGAGTIGNPLVASVGGGYTHSFLVANWVAVGTAWYRLLITHNQHNLTPMYDIYSGVNNINVDHIEIIDQDSFYLYVVFNPDARFNGSIGVR